MSIQFRGGTTGDSRRSYFERRKYIRYLKSTGLNFLDTLYDQKLYGLINQDCEVIAPLGETTDFGEYAANVVGINFVVEAFNNFREFYQQVAAETNLGIPSLIADLRPSKSFVDFDEKFSEYEVTVSDILLDKLGAFTDLNLTDFRIFFDKVNQLIFDEDMADYRLTKSGYALSKDSNVHHTGLYVDLGAGYPVQVDSLKGDLIQDENFKCYVEFANDHGFLVDINVPWRLAVDLSSPKIRDTILNGRPANQFKNFYNDIYTLKVAYDDYWSLKSFYEKLFVENLRRNNINTLPQLSPLSVRDWLDALLLNRFHELGLMTSPNKTEYYDLILQETLDRNRVYGLSSISGAFGYINTFSSQELKKILEY